VGFEGIDFLLVTFCFVAEGSLHLTLVEIYEGRDLCGFAGLGVFFVHVIFNLLFEGGFLLFGVMKDLFKAFRLRYQS